MQLFSALIICESYLITLSQYRYNSFNQVFYFPDFIRYAMDSSVPWLDAGLDILRATGGIALYLLRAFRELELNWRNPLLYDQRSIR